MSERSTHHRTRGKPRSRYCRPQFRRCYRASDYRAGAIITLSSELRENPQVHATPCRLTFGADDRSGFAQDGDRANRTIACAPGFEIAQLVEGVRGDFGND